MTSAIQQDTLRLSLMGSATVNESQSCCPGEFLPKLRHLLMKLSIFFPAKTRTLTRGPQSSEVNSISSFQVSSRLLSAVRFGLCFSIFAFGRCQEPLKVRFRVVANTMIVVPVTINGAGPFDFLLDTGSSDTVVDRRLAEELHLPSAGEMIL